MPVNSTQFRRRVGLFFFYSLFDSLLNCLFYSLFRLFNNRTFFKRNMSKLFFLRHHNASMSHNDLSYLISFSTVASVLGQFPDGHFSDGRFPDGQFPERQFPKGQFPEWTIPRTDISPTDSSPNDISPNRHFPERTFPRITFFYLCKSFLPLVYKSRRS